MTPGTADRPTDRPAPRATPRATPPGAAPDPGTADPKEIARFEAMAGGWWDPDGDFRPLHRFNPVRLAYIRDRLAPHFGRAPLASKPLRGLAILDIGCGGGLLSEPMARLGATVTGIDAGEANIRVARDHAEAGGLAIDYRQTTAEDLAGTGARFDAVLNMEVVEHVADRDAFLAAACALVAPGGAMITATLNRTVKSFALAVVGAEYVLRWLPRGTHRWSRFLRPSELAHALSLGGLEVADITGVTYNPLANRWTVSRDLDVNYIMFATTSRSRPGRRAPAENDAGRK